MFRLENIEFLYALGVLPIMLLLYILMNRWKKRALKKFGDVVLIKQLMPDVSKTKPTLKFILLIVGFTFLIIGILNPQIGSKLEEVKREGADLMIALDVSNSMKAEDLSPNRLERAKHAIAKLIDKLEGDRIGIVVFGGEAYVQLPITTDYAAAKLFLETIDTDIIPTQGTAIGKAIDVSAEAFGKDLGKNKAIVIITDGENHEDDAINSAQVAAEKGIVVHTIGMGSVNGSPIPVYKNNLQTGYRKDKEGNTIVTKLNEPMLQQIAAAGNGIYVRASNSEAGLNNVLAQVKKMEKKQFESKLYSDYEDRFQYFIVIALFFLILELFISEQKSKWFEKLNLFGEKKN